MNVLVSACLLGENCKYSGGNNYNQAVCDFARGHQVVPVCPEILGGLSTPRAPSERRGSGVVTKDGADVTEQYRKGAQEVLRLARLYGCTAAVLKERSPACGSGEIYDGTFTHTVVDGFGVAAELLAENGIRVLGESELEAFLRE